MSGQFVPSLPTVSSNMIPNVIRLISSWYACRRLLLLLISAIFSLSLSGCINYGTHVTSLAEKSSDTCPMPFYPAQAQALRKEGVVNAVLHLNPEGKVVSVDTAGDEIFFDSTVKALRRCKFTAGTSAEVLKTITFSLDGVASK